MFEVLLSQFHPVIILPATYEVLDFSRAQEAKVRAVFTVGRYNEKRPGLYTQKLFQGDRIYHMGIDIGGPAGTPVHAFYEGELYAFADNAEAGDYGPTLVTRHLLKGQVLYALHGHLSRTSLRDKVLGQKFASGETIGFLGESTENGGWPPHVHFQLSLSQPKGADMPGVVSERDLEEALKTFPDPRLVLGPIY